MDRTERFYRIEQLLQDRKLVPLRDFLDELEVSRATFKRDIEYLRDRLHAPIEYDRDAGGYRFGKPAQAQGGPRHELPGLWFNASEVHALLTMQHLLKGVEPGLLAPHVDPLLARLRGMLATDDLSVPEVERRIKIIRMAARKMKPAYFEVAASATLKRRRLAVRYWSRYKDEVSERELSPQRLVFYRGNWYLDAWCHLRKDIRSFALDGLRKASLLTSTAKNIPRPNSTRCSPRATASSPGASCSRPRCASRPPPHAGWPAKNGTRSKNRTPKRTAAMCWRFRTMTTRSW